MTWRPRFGRFLRHYSLRQRYLGVAIFLGIVVAASTLLTEQYVSSTNQASVSNSETRNAIHQRTRAIRNAIWGSEYALQAYILKPMPWHREAVTTNLDNARQDIAILREQAWTQKHNLQALADSLSDNLAALSRHSDELMDIRADASRLFPSANLMDDTLSPANAGYLAATELALNEIAAEPGGNKSEAFQAFEDARHSWSQMISAFRLYIVRISGIYSNSEAGLQEASHNTRLLLESNEASLQHLTDLDKAGKLGLQASDALEQLRELTQTWRSGFEAILASQQSAQWRNDVPLISNTIQPLFGEIWNRLDRFDAQIEADAERDITLWIDVGRQLNTNLILLSLLAFTFIAAGFVFFTRTVLNPLAKISHAMKAIAMGEAHTRLPRANSLEARELIDAFVHMRRKIHERQLAMRHQALHDTLTGLPNRALIKDRLEQVIRSSERLHRSTFSLLMIDLDRFKEINDSLGHQAGDHVLCEVGRRLTALLRKSDTVARLGGDEFAVLLPDSDCQQAREIATHIADAIGQPLLYQDRDLPIGASVGIATYPQHGRDTETLFKCADVAMYAAKQDNLSHSVYSAQQDPHSIGRLAMISELRNAIINNGLTLHYQPKLEMISGKTIGVEALLRWPKWSAIPTEYLINTAEATGLIQILTECVLRQALAQIANWQARGIDMPIAVNLSTWNLAHTEIDTTVQTLLREYNVPAAMLELEITENAMMKNPERAHAILEKLRVLGVNLTVDDYGTGYSSLSYLKSMPVDQIKIDKSFVIDMLDDENNAVIVRSTIDLAHNLGLTVVAEGVSSADIWKRLEALGCDSAQGYYIARPMPAEAFEDWLNTAINPGSNALSA